MTNNTLTEKQLDEFVRGYCTAALWSSTDSVVVEQHDQRVDVNLDDYEWADGEVEKRRAECEAFIDYVGAEYIHEYRERLGPVAQRGEGTAYDWAGHDFWLTRNGHGAGFWDRGIGPLGTRLTDASKTFGGVDLYLGDDLLVYS